MRKLLLLFGLLMLIPTSAFAADPLSPWLNDALEKMQSGLDFAASKQSDECGDLQDDIDKQARKSVTIENALSTIRRVITTRQQITQHQDDLRTRTLCFRSDLHLIEEKMEEVRTALISAAENCSLNEAQILQQVYLFGSDVQATYTLHAHDPGYQTTMLQKTYAFESEEAWENGTQDDENSTSGLCPFTSEILPHTIAYEQGTAGILNSYGCDETVLQTLTGDLEEERDAQLDFVRKVTGFTDQVNQSIRRFKAAIDAILGQVRRGTLNRDDVISDAPLQTPVPHAVVNGCLRLADLPQDPRTQPLTEDYTDFADVTLPDAIDLPLGLLFTSAYDSFSIYANPLLAIKRAMQRKQELAGRTALAGHVAESGSTYMPYIRTAYTEPRAMLLAARSHAKEQAILDSWSRDAIERSADAFAPLQRAVFSLGLAVEERRDADTNQMIGGYLPNYIRDLTYFLRRSCVYSHCSARLDAILKRITNPYCHPFTSGKYTEAKVAEKCFCLDDTLPEYNQYCKAEEGDLEEPTD